MINVGTSTSSQISRATDSKEKKVPQMTRLRAPALALAENWRSAQTSTDFKKLAGGCQSAPP